jgi:rSAM/selenodomain-associated transferase 2
VDCFSTFVKSHRHDLFARRPQGWYQISAMLRSYSVIVPVLGEETRVNALVDHIRTVGYGRRLEILIADGHPQRTTLAALERPGVLAVPAPRGRASQMNAAARHATGDVLLFLHADCALSAGAFQAIDTVLADGAHQAGAFDLGIRSRSWSLRLIARAASLRSRLTRTPYGDQAQFFCRDAFAALRGFADMPILEDVDIMRRARRAGLGIGFAKGRTLASPRRWEAEGVWKRTFLNWLIIILYLLGVAPERLAPLHRPAPRPKGDS